MGRQWNSCEIRPKTWQKIDPWCNDAKIEVNGIAIDLTIIDVHLLPGFCITKGGNVKFRAWIVGVVDAIPEDAKLLVVHGDGGEGTLMVHAFARFGRWLIEIIDHFFRLRLVCGYALLSETFIYIMILLSKKVNKPKMRVAVLTKSRLIILFKFLTTKCIIWMRTTKLWNPHKAITGFDFAL